MPTAGDGLQAVVDLTAVGHNSPYEVLFRAHFESMTRLAHLLGADDPENVAQEAFVRLHDRRGQLRDPTSAVAYLRAAVTNISHNRRRHLTVVRRHIQLTQTPPAPPDAADIGEGPATQALRGLPLRQRQALVLKYWMQLSEREIAAAMNVSNGSVKTHLSRGLTALRAALASSGGAEPR